MSLTPKQLDVIKALSSGLSVTAAADAAGIHRTTVHHWSRNIPEFRETVAAVKQAQIDLTRDEMNSLAAPSVAILRKVIEDETASPALRVRTALAIIKFVTTPEKSPSPKDAPFEQLLDGAYLTGYRMAQERAAAAASSPEPSEIHHNSSHSSPEADEQPQTPRNALCPCGSGNKYKRCCGKNAPPVLGRAA